MTAVLDLTAFLRHPALPTECRATYARHLAFAVLDTIAAGLLLNAPLMALKGMASREWELAVQLPISSVGMFLVLYLGGLMAGRHPMPFAVVPGMAYAASSFGMAMTDQPLRFLVLAGVATLFETISRPAVTAIIRLGWGLDPLLLATASVLAGFHPAGAVFPSLMGRASRGLVMGGSWVLWWQVGVNHFAKPGGDTTRYMGLVLFINGLARLLAPLAGAWMLAGFSLGGTFCVGGLLVLLSAGLSWARFLRERGDKRYATMEAFEAEYRS